MKNSKFGLSAVASRCERVLQGTSTPKRPSYAFRGSETKIPSLQTTDPFVGASKVQQYTGTAMLGVATMHKSNAVPVFREEDAKDIASMRR